MPLSIGENMNYLQVCLVVKKQFLKTNFIGFDVVASGLSRGQEIE